MSRSKSKVRTTVKHVEVEDEKGYFINEYQVLECIGQGASGEVFRVSRKIGDSLSYFAMKKMRRKVVRRFGAKKQPPSENIAPK